MNWGTVALVFDRSRRLFIWIHSNREEGIMRRFLEFLTVALAVSVGLTGAVWADDAGTINHRQKGVAAGAPVGDILQVTIHEYDDWAPCWGAFPWSKDGEWIVYQSYREELPAGDGG